MHCKKNCFFLTTEWLPQLQSSYGYESFTLVLETNWIRQPEKQVPNVYKQPSLHHYRALQVACPVIVSNRQ